MANLTGSTTAVFFVRLSTAVDEIVDVDWNTRDGTAIAGKDYEAASGTVSFLPGETEKAIDVVVYGQDDVSANGKKFYIELKPPANAVLCDALAECVITVADEDGVLVTSLVVAQGKRGLKGDPGLSAYEQAVLMGYVGTLEDWMQEQADAAAAAQRASDYAAAAASAATKAENAATAASFLGNIFPTPEAGVDPVTGVGNGAYYNVRSTEDDSYLVEYQNIGGVPTPSGKSYPSAGYVQAVAEFTALPFVPGESYGVNRRVQLDNGDIVKSTVANNTVDPNVDMTGWVKVNSASQIVDESGNTQQDINNQIKTPLSINADDTGSIDVTSQLASLLDPAGKHVIQLTKGIYLTDGFDVPPNTIVYANAAIFKRRTYSGKPVINVGENSLIIGAVIDGNKDTLGNTGGIKDQGIRLQSGAVALFCVSDNNHSHGITARANTALVTSENQKILFCKTSNNGFNAGSLGTADGINVLNSNNALVFGCESYNNARTGFVAETYNGNLIPEDKRDLTFSTGVKFKACKASGNSYNDYNAEVVSEPSFDDVSGNVVTFRGSLRANVCNARVGIIYGQDADYASVSNSRISSNTSSSSRLYLRGKAPKVSNVDVVIGDSVTLSGTTVEIIDTTGFNGEVSNVSVNRAFNGMLLRVANVNNLRVDAASNVKFFIGRNEGSTNVLNLKQLFNKKLEVYSSGLPTQGAWNKNDIVWNTFFSATAKTMAWVCTSSGVFGTATPPVFEAVTIMSRGVAVPNAAGANPTKAEFDALLTSLRNSGQLST